MSKDNIYVQILREAKRYIRTKRVEYVCCAVGLAAHDLGFHYHGPEAFRLRDWINESIRRGMSPRVLTVEQWLRMQGIYPTAPQMREYRLRWIDHMIELWKDVPDPEEI